MRPCRIVRPASRLHQFHGILRIRPWRIDFRATGAPIHRLYDFDGGTLAETTGLASLFGSIFHIEFKGYRRFLPTGRANGDRTPFHVAGRRPGYPVSTAPRWPALMAQSRSGNRSAALAAARSESA